MRQASFPVETRRLQSGSKKRLVTGRVCPHSTRTLLATPFVVKPASQILTIASREPVANMVVEIEMMEHTESEWPVRVF